MIKSKSYLLALFLGVVLQSSAYAEAKPTGLAAYESVLTNAFFGLLAAFVGLVAWEFLDGRKASRSSLDIAKLAAAAAKKQSAAGAPSGSLTALEAPPTTRPFAPPPPPPPPKQKPVEAPGVEEASPFAAPSRDESVTPYSAPATAVAGAMRSSQSVESTVAFNPSTDAGSSGGWADLLQRVRAGEPEAASFQDSSPPPLTEDESFSAASDPQPATEQAVSPASSSEAWEALLKRTTTGEGQKSKAPAADVGKISLSSSRQLPGESPPEPSAPSAFSLGGGAFGAAPISPTPPMPSFESGAAFPSSEPAQKFALPSGPADPFGGPLGSSDVPSFSFSTDPSSEAVSPFSSGGDSPSFQLPGAPPPAQDFGSEAGGFQLPGGAAGGSSPFDFGASTDSPSSSTLPLSDLFSGSKPSAGGLPAFQLPTSSDGGGGQGGSMDFLGSAPSESEHGGQGLGRTISLDFAKGGGGQKPPPPLPKTEG